MENGKFFQEEEKGSLRKSNVFLTFNFYHFFSVVVVGIIKYEEGLMSVLKNQLKLINENC